MPASTPASRRCCRRPARARARARPACADRIPKGSSERRFSWVYVRRLGSGGFVKRNTSVKHVRGALNGAFVTILAWDGCRARPSACAIARASATSPIGIDKTWALTQSIAARVVDLRAEWASTRSYRARRWSIARSLGGAEDAAIGAIVWTPTAGRRPTATAGRRPMATAGRQPPTIMCSTCRPWLPKLNWKVKRGGILLLGCLQLKADGAIGEVCMASVRRRFGDSAYEGIESAIVLGELIGHDEIRGREPESGGPAPRSASTKAVRAPGSNGLSTP